MNSSTNTKYFQLLSLLFLLSSDLTAQVLIPYLGKNGLYGFADTLGNLIVPPRHKEFPKFAWLQRGYYSFDAEKRHNFLLNGEELNFHNGIQSINYGLIYTDIEYQPIDTLHQVLCLSGQDSFTIMHLGNGRRYTGKSGATSSCGIAYDRHMRSAPMVRFQFGFMRVPDGTGYNLLDTTLNRVFNTPVFELSIVDAETVLVGNALGKAALYDTNGEQLTGFNWDIISPLKGTSLFATNASEERCNFPKAKGPVSVIDRNGRQVIAPRYKEIYTASDALVLTDSTGLSALYNMQGKEILPFKGQRIVSYYPGQYRIFDDHGKRIVDASGRDLIAPGYELIEPCIDGVYWGRKNGNWVEVMDISGKVLLSDSASQVFCRRIGKEVFYLIGQNGAQKLYSAKGKRIVSPNIFQTVELFEPKGVKPLLQCRDFATKLYGLIDSDGNEVLPLAFEEIRKAQYPEDSEYMFGRRKGAYLWETFTLGGTLAGFPLSLEPVSPNAHSYKVKKEWDARQSKVVLKDGRTVPFPKSWGVYPNVKVAESPKGLAVAKLGDSQFEVIGADGKSILPVGYKACNPFFNPDDFRRSGLITVVSETYTQPKKQPASATRTTHNTIDGYGSGAPDVSVEERVKYGVVNAQGEWVIQPNDHTYFKPYSYHLVGAFAPIELDHYPSRPRQLYVVNHANARIIEVAHVDRESDASKSLRVSITRSGAYRTAWFDLEGNQITEFEYGIGPGDLNSGGLVWRHRGAEKILSLLDANGKVVKEFEWASQKVTQGSLMRGYAIAFNNEGQNCIIDSLGNIVIPFTTDIITYHHGIGCITRSQPNVNPKIETLYTLDGAFLMNNITEVGRLRLLDNSWTALHLTGLVNQISQKKVLVLDQDRKLMYTLTDFEITDHRRLGSEGYLLIGQSPTTKQQYFVDGLTGKAFKEE